MNDGELFKTIRQSRNISQKNICKNFISRTTLSKFENHKTLITIENFWYLLNSIDVSVEEFNYMKNNFSYSEKEYIIYLFNNLFSNTDYQEIDHLIDLCNQYLIDNYSRAIKCIMKTLYVLKYTSDSEDKIDCLTKIYAADIWNELSNIDSWTILDIKIINCCLHFFDPETYVLISEQLVKSLKKYKDFSNICTLEAAIYSNLTLLFLINNHLDKAKEFSKLALEKSIKSKRIDYIAVALIRRGFILFDNSMKEKGFLLLNIFSDPTLKEVMDEEVKLIKNIL